MINDTQVPERFKKLLDAELEKYNQGRSIQVRRSIPDTTEIPIEDPRHWLKIPNIICVFVDMKGSTQLSASTHDTKTAGAYQLFTGTAVRLFSEFECPYIDVRGDGVFALFNEDQPYRALAATITFKTFVHEYFTPTIKRDTSFEVSGHYGIDQKTVLVRKLGLKRHGGRTDRQNEVWAGKPVNMASKLAASAQSGQLLVSDRFFKSIPHDLARKSCGCPAGEKKELWREIDLSTDPKYDFKTAYSIQSNWCAQHGTQYCESILQLDQ
ncbi:hypothetical protein [Archangium violaceum]|uniref:hypothetical protein n=1 Tax=Archangium violaceum TaxID=83451 RepID=UPI0036D9749D